MTSNSPRERPLRLWPGVVLAALVVVLRFVVPNVAAGATAAIVGVLGGVLAGLAVFVWWLLFSRAPWSERLIGVGLAIAAMAGTYLVLDESIATGAMGMMFPLYAIPGLGIAFVVWAAVSRPLTSGARLATLAVVVALAAGFWALLRTDGMMGDGAAQLKWRWQPTAEERLLARVGDEVDPLPPSPTAAPAPGPEAPDAGAPSPEPMPVSPPPATAGELPVGGVDTEGRVEPMSEAVPEPAPPTRAEWPGFRGPDRNGVVRGARIGTDWSAAPPVELWRRPVGPGWSSFSVAGDLFYTQEQRGDYEVVSCYRLTTGEPVWAHRDEARFWESNGGAGPRATPTISNGRVFTMGATGILNALDADTGAALWSRDAASDTNKEIPGWGFASSPLVVGDLVIVATAGVLAAYDAATGEPRWIGSEGGWGYSSPHLVTIDGVEQIVLLNGAGAVGVAPADGARLWEHSWPGDGIVQPGLTPDGDILIGAGSGMGPNAASGIRRVAIGHGPGGWSTEERWTSNGLKPYFNDFVVHEGHAYGVDGRLLSSIDLSTGERNWKGGRYGHGQVLLLPAQDLLLVLSEQGELALVGATPGGFTEVARAPGIEGKTWNHPVLAGNVLLVRNDREMAAFRLPPPTS